MDQEHLDYADPPDRAGPPDNDPDDRQRIWRALIVATAIAVALVLPVCCIAAAVIGFLYAFLHTMDQMN